MSYRHQQAENETSSTSCSSPLDGLCLSLGMLYEVSVASPKEADINAQRLSGFNLIYWSLLLTPADRARRQLAQGAAFLIAGWIVCLPSWMFLGAELFGIRQKK